MLFSFKNVVQKIRQIARRAVCSATAVVAAMEKKRRDSAFTKEQEIFIIKQFNCGLGPIEVRRAFRKQFGMSRHLQKLQPHQFKSVFERFLKNGVASAPNLSKGRKEKSLNKEKYFVKLKTIRQMYMSHEYKNM